jgi:hypothetical protein
MSYLFRLNFAAIILIPKTKNAYDMRSFRPISLLNRNFKIFSRVLTSRLEIVCHMIIAKEKSTFIKGKLILESVVNAHEVLHAIHKSKQHGVILKLDYEKAYDRVNLDFLIEILESRGFGETWIGWIKKIVFGGSVSILANGEDNNTFKTGRGSGRVTPYPHFYLTWWGMC